MGFSRTLDDGARFDREDGRIVSGVSDNPHTVWRMRMKTEKKGELTAITSMSCLMAECSKTFDSDAWAEKTLRTQLLEELAK